MAHHFPSEYTSYRSQVRALIPGVLRAFANTNEIITSLMLNYVAGYLLTYLIFDSSSYWRDVSTLQARSCCR